MSASSLLKKYSLPESVRVLIKKTPQGGYYVKFPDYAGCMTEADGLDLYEKITDALLTYFEVPRKEALKMNVIYYPQQHAINDLKKLEESKSSESDEMKANFVYFSALNSSHGQYSNIR